MRFAKLSSILDFASVIIKKCNEIQQINSNTIFRIDDVKQTTPGKISLVIQFVGKATFIECTPQEILADDKFLEGFSKRDIRTITFYACQDNSPKPLYKIISQEFSDKLNKLLFKLKKTNSNETILKTGGEILLDKNIINNLSQEDVRDISYVAGHERSHD